MTISLLQRRLPLFPVSTRLQAGQGGQELTIAGCSVATLAREYGTPLYLYDQATLDAALDEYRGALDAHYPGASGLTYAGKAYLCTALAQWALDRQLWLDCTGAGELHIARNAGASRQSLVVHGVNKSPSDLDAAFKSAGTLVVDHLGEIEHLISRARHSQGFFPDLWLRLRPGTWVETHAHIQTGYRESKFGMDMDEAARAVERCLESSLPLAGVHFHLGSNLRDPAPIASAVRSTLDLLVAMRSRTGWLPSTLSPGGGLGVAYHEDDLPQPSISEYVQSVCDAVADACRARALPLPRLQLEPGRSLVARAGVAIYSVGAVKYAHGRRWLLLDGGLADNPRPALYEARYSALPVREPGRPPQGQAWLGGPYCESGDVLAADLTLADLHPGELLAIPASGAYQLSMSSNYNGACRPAVLWLADGQPWLIQRRETLDELVARDFRIGSIEC